MKISNGEKLILLMLSDVYQKLGLEGGIDPEFVRSAIFKDQLWAFSWKYTGIQFSDDETPEIVKDVVDVLDMWSFIELAYDKLSDTEKETLKEQAHPFGDNPRFTGFDGNHETEYMSVARFLINDLERFDEFKGRSMNSHRPSIEGYRRMLSAFEPIRSTLAFRDLGVDQLAAILLEQIHPSNRS